MDSLDGERDENTDICLDNCRPLSRTILDLNWT